MKLKLMTMYLGSPHGGKSVQARSLEPDLRPLQTIVSKCKDENTVKVNNNNTSLSGFLAPTSIAAKKSPIVVLPQACFLK